MTRPTHWKGVDSKEHWPETGCPIDWEFLDGLESDDGAVIYGLLAQEAQNCTDPQTVSWIACHALVAMNYIGSMAEQ